jgi:hypothetical protein
MYAHEDYLHMFGSVQGYRSGRQVFARFIIMWSWFGNVAPTHLNTMRGFQIKVAPGCKHLVDVGFLGLLCEHHLTQRRERATGEVYVKRLAYLHHVPTH